VDQAILGEEDRVVVIRFGHDWDPQCMQMDEILASVADQIKNFAVIFLVDISKVPDFNTMYELYDPCTTMFFFRWVRSWYNLHRERKEEIRGCKRRSTTWGHKPAAQKSFLRAALSRQQRCPLYGCNLVRTFDTGLLCKTYNLLWRAFYDICLTAVFTVHCL
jgi:thiol-disulfide isomerase/thioredoxin